MIRYRASSWMTITGIVMVSTALLVGCATSSEDNPMRGIPNRDLSVRVTVDNQDFSDAVIYANWIGGTRQRLGTVTGKTMETLQMEWRSYRVEFEADFVGRRGKLSFAPIDVYGGDHVRLVIQIQG